MTLPACDRIIELAEKATRGPWKADDKGLITDPDDTCIAQVYDNPDSGMEPFDEEPSAYNMQLITESRALAKPLALALNEAVRAIEAAERREKNEYLGWSYAGGVNDCEHGYGEGIPCPKCDAVTVLTALDRINELLKEGK